jgi:drug/metabolite transporter (DMT)-like permease
MTELLGILLAVGCALTTNLGFLYKHRGACAAPAVDFRHPLRSGRALFASPLFAIGMLIACGSWLCHIGAMAMIPLSVVQAVLAGGVVLLAVMAERMLGLRIGGRQWAGLAMTAAGLVLLGISLPAVHGSHSHYSLPGMIAFEGGLVAVGTLLIIGPRIGVPTHRHGVMFGAASGALFGVSDISIKAISGLIGSHGMLGIVSPWLFVALLASVVAFFSSAKSLQDGDPIPVIAVTSTAATVSGIVGGIVVFGDPFPAHPAMIVVQCLAFVLVVFAAWMIPAPARAAGIVRPAPAV